MKKIVIIGAGASGMMAGISASENENKVQIFEKNEKAGKKIYITGKGRCNLTNASSENIFFENIIRNSKFIYSSYNQFSNIDTINYFEKAGLKTKIERGNRVFPESDKSSDVIRSLVDILKKKNVEINYNSPVKDVVLNNGKFEKIILKSGKEIYADALIIATGGLSYPSTGSTGDGYEFAVKTGHTIVTTEPSIVALNSPNEFVKTLQGLSLKNVEVHLYRNGKKIFTDFGEMLFTHFGVSGPIILSSSAYVSLKDKGLRLIIDLKPGLDLEQLDKRILRDFEKRNNKIFKNALDDLLPKKLIPSFIKMSGVSENRVIRDITKEDRLNIIKLMKNFPIDISGKRGYNEAVITRGGVQVKEINPKTMESKIVEGIYFAGEIIDLDAMTGGYNLQVAWTTGWVAGLHAGKSEVAYD